MQPEPAQHAVAVAPLVPLAFIVGLPLAGALINLILGSGLRWLSRGWVQFFAVGSVFASFCVAFYSIFGIPATPLVLAAPAAGVAIFIAASVARVRESLRWWLAVLAALAVFVLIGFTQRWSDGTLVSLFKASDHEHAIGFSSVLYRWIEVDELKIDLAFRLDTLSAVMVLIVTGVGTLIHLYSCGYMSEEKRYSAYFGYLNLFTAAMLILVLAANMPVMFIGWEGVGLCSYLLIGFWFENTDYASAGKKAFVVNRIGDFAFLLGMFLLWYVVNQMPSAGHADGSHAAPGLDFNDLRLGASTAMYSANDVLFGSGERIAAVIGILLFVGACGKSAQIPLYVWLPDAMAGPTPVSALIHAATMVTAGVYMVCRLSFLFASSTMAMAVIATVGTATALMAAFYAFAQTDLKKVLAYSTVSQLGFMFAAAGTGNWAAAIFHLAMHAFFKAGLFLGAGSVMHGMNGSGDITKMGGLRKHMPITRWTFLVYCLAITGVPIFAGFFSKDEILGGLWALGRWGHPPEGWPPLFANILWLALLVAALGTAIYMWRLYFLVFSGDERSDDAHHAHESPWTMTAPLVVLAGLAAIAGLVGLPHLSHVHWPWALHALSSWLEPAIDTATEPHNSDVATELLMGGATIVALLGIFIAWSLYRRGPSKKLEQWTAEGQPLHDAYLASKNKLWVDEGYDLLIVRPFRAIARLLFEFVDRFLIDTVLVGGWAFVVGILSRISRWVQNGQVQRYIVAMVVGAAAIFFFAARGHHATFSYKKVSAGEVELRAEPGAGLAGVGVTYRWDVDGDGLPDKKPGATDKTPPDEAFVDDAVLMRHPGELGSHVTLWIQPKNGGKSVEVTRDIDFSQFEPPAGSGSGSGSASGAEPAPPPAAAAAAPVEGSH